MTNLHHLPSSTDDRRVVDATFIRLHTEAVDALMVAGLLGSALAVQSARPGELAVVAQHTAGQASGYAAQFTDVNSERCGAAARACGTLAAYLRGLSSPVIVDTRARKADAR